MSEQLLVTLGVQDKGAKSQITALNKELRILDKEFKTADKASKSYESGTEGLSKKLDVLTNKYTTQKTKLEVYSRQINNSKEQLEKKKKALETLTNAEGDNQKQIQKLTSEISKMELDIRNATREMSLTETELQALESEIKDVEKAIKNKPFEDMKKDLEQLGSKVEDTGQKLKTIGQGMNSVGNGLLALSAPVVGFAGYAVKASMDFEASMSKVKAISGATGKDLELLEAKAKEMGRSTSKSATESAEALQYMALAGWDTSQMLAGIEPILRLSEAGNIDLARASDLVTDSMSALGIEVKDLDKYLDIVANTQRKANTTADGLMEAYLGVGGTLKNLKVPASESATWLGILANRGIKGSEAGNSLNSTLVNLMGTSGQSSEALESLGVSAWDSAGNFKGMEATLKDLDTALSKCTEEQRNQFTAMIGGKTQMDTLNALLSGLNEEYVDLKASIEDSNGALGEMAATMQDNTKGNITRLKSEMEGLGIQVGENLLPHINDLIAGVSNLIKWFGSLDEGTQKSIIKMGLFAFGGGTALKVVGNLTSGIGGAVTSLGSFIGNLSKADVETGKLSGKTTGLVGGIGKLASGISLTNPVVLALAGGITAVAGGMVIAKTNSDLWNKSVLTGKDELGFFEGVVNSFTGAVSMTSKELEEAGLKAKGFSENVSTEFQEAVKAAESNLNDLQNELRETNLDNVMDDSERSKFVSRVNEVCSDAITTIKAYQDESTEELKKLFLSDGVIDETEQKTLDFLTRQSQTHLEEVNKEQKAVMDLYNKAIADKGYLNNEEIEQITEHLANIQSLKLGAMAENNDELLEAQAGFLARVKNIDLEEASALMQEKAQLRDGELTAIKEKYDTQVELLKLKNKSASEEDRLNNEAIIARLETQKNEELNKEVEKYQGYLDILQEKNPQILENINALNGEILSNKDKNRVEILKLYEQEYKDINSITETGMYELENTTTGAMDRVYISIDDTTGKITGAWSDAQKKAGGLTDTIAKDALKMGNEVKSSNETTTKQLNALGGAFINSNGQIEASNGLVIKSLKDFQKESDGTGRGILDLNGKKIEVKSNTEGEITNFKELKKEMNALNGKKITTTVTVNYKENNKPSGLSSGGYSTQMNRSVEQNPISRAAMPMAYSLNEMGADTSSIQPASNVASMFNDVITGGSYFSPNSNNSVELKSNVTMRQSNNTKESSINSKELANEIAIAVAKAIQGINLNANLSFEHGNLVGDISNSMALNTKRRR